MQKKIINPCFLQGLRWNRFCNDGTNGLMSIQVFFKSPLYRTPISPSVSLHVCLNINKTQMLKPTNMFVILLQIKYRVNVLFIHVHSKELKLNKDVNTTSQAATQYIHIDSFFLLNELKDANNTMRTVPCIHNMNQKSNVRGQSSFQTHLNEVLMSGCKYRLAPMRHSQQNTSLKRSVLLAHCCVTAANAVERSAVH